MFSFKKNNNTRRECEGLGYSIRIVGGNGRDESLYGGPVVGGIGPDLNSSGENGFGLVIYFVEVIS